MKTHIAKDGKALVDIVVHGFASARTERAADDLAQMLEKITGASFEIKAYSDRPKIVLGTHDDFPALHYHKSFNINNPLQADSYVMKSVGNDLHLIAHSDLGVTNAVWGFLRKLGYRQYFPESIWEFIPSIPDLSVDVYEIEIPSFFMRRGPKAPAWSDDDLWNDWNKKNCLVGVRIRTSHTYGSIERRNEKILEANPHFVHRGKFRISAVGEWEGKPLTCIQMIVNDQLQLIKDNPHYNSLSMDPSDGTGGWITKEEDNPEEWNFKPGDRGYIDPLGGKYKRFDASHPTDIVVFLANVVAEAVNEYRREEGLPEVYIGIYAYARHSEPPNIPVHPMIVVSTVSSFSGVAPGWRAKGAQIMGSYDRLNLIQSSRGVPPVQMGGNMRYVENTIPFYYYNLGGRLLIGDTTDTWSLYGLPYYCLAWKLWDVEADVKEMENEFIQTMFGDVAGIMKKYFFMVNRQNEQPPRTRHNYIAYAFRYLNDAYLQTDEPKVRQRLEYMTLFWVFVQLFHEHELSRDKQESGEKFMRHLYRMTSIMLNPVTQFYRHYIGRGPVERTWLQMEEFNFRRPMSSITVGMTLNNRWPWEDNRTFTSTEIHEMRTMAIEKYQPEEWGFDPVEFSEDLRPVDALNLETPGRFGRQLYTRGYNEIQLWMEAEKPFRLLARNRSVRVGSDMIMSLTTEQEVLMEPVYKAVVPADDRWHEILLWSPYTGKHTVSFNARSDWAEVVWPDMKISGTGTDADSYWSRVGSREWRNGAGWRITRSGSRDDWSVRDSQNNEVGTGKYYTWEPFTATSWTGVLEDAIVSKYQGQRACMEFKPNGPNDWDRSTWEYYFYVPKGTKVIGGHFENQDNTEIYYPTGSKVVDWRSADGKTGPFAIDVPEGADGLLWRVISTRGGKRSLLTVPSQVARSVEELMLPREVIEKDAGVTLPDLDEPIGDDPGDDDEPIIPIPPDDDNGDEPVDPPDDEEPPEDPEPPVEPTQPDIYKLGLHGIISLPSGTVIMRVPGGWKYNDTFVPFNNEFML